MEATSNIAPFFGGYISDYLGKTQALGNLPFQPFEGDRFAGPSALQQQAFQGIAGLTTAPVFDSASNALTQAANMAAQSTGFTPTNFNAPGYTAQQMTGPAGITSLLDASDANTVQGFMNPFTQNVIDIAKRQAQTAFNTQDQQRNAAAKAAGAFGGSRHGILGAMALNDFNTQLNDIQLKGSEAAFRNAMDAINAQRSADLQRQQFNKNMEYNTALQNMLAANQAGQFNAGQNLDAQRLSEQSRQFGATLGQQGINSLINAGSAMGNLGTAQNAAQANILNQQLGAGAIQQAFAQQPLDFAYNQWQQSLAFPYQQLQFQRDMLQGLPLSVNSAPDRNALLEGLMGAGGIYNLLFGGN
jgi:hypothetical protein